MECLIDIASELRRPPHEPVLATLLNRLQATAETLAGTRRMGPDLAAALQSLGRSACRDMTADAFASWLLAQVSLLRAGSTAPALHDWLRAIFPLLRAIESQVLHWLQDVVDMRFPLAQYMSQASYLDHHVGAVLDHLREQGLYDQTTIVFTSPHGEALGERDIYFHHHCLLESVLRVPLLWKPGVVNESPRSYAGLRIGGICDGIDVFPTIVDSLALPAATLPGRSRWHNLCTGAAIAEHSSFAADVGRTMVSVTRAPYTLVQALAAVDLGSDWRWREGDSRLFRTEPGDNADLHAVHPAVANSLQQVLDGWLKEFSRSQPERRAA